MVSGEMTTPPTGIATRRSERVVEITWGPDHVGRFGMKDLRASCACAHCVDERTGKRLLDPDTITADIHIAAAELVGNYAVRFDFSDGHDTGIYTWKKLRQLCPCPQCRPGVS